jgi:hypothetical protein
VEKNMLKVFNRWVRIPLLFVSFALLSFVTAGTPVAFEFGNWLIGSAVFAVGSMVLGLAFVGFMSPLCDLLGITKETRAKSGLTFSAINVVYMTVVFLLVEALLPGLLTMASIWSGVIAAVGFNVLLALTITRSSQSAG